MQGHTSIRKKIERMFLFVWTSGTPASPQKLVHDPMIITRRCDAGIFTDGNHVSFYS